MNAMEINASKTLFIIQGLSGSGKSTISRYIAESRFGVGWESCICSTDSFFYQNGAYVFDKSKLSEYHNANRNRVESLMQQGHSTIIVDNTNVTIKEASPYLELAELYDYAIRIIRVQADLAECAKLNSHGVPLHKIKNRARLMENLLPYTKEDEVSVASLDWTYDINKKDAVIVDLDGTLSLFDRDGKSGLNRRSPYDHHKAGRDNPNQAIVKILNSLKDDIFIIFMSGREERYRWESRQFLLNQCKFDERWLNMNTNLFMRKNDDKRADWIVKYQMIKEIVHPNYNILWTWDDRNQVVKMQRQAGLQSWQVCDGNY